MRDYRIVIDQKIWNLKTMLCCRHAKRVGASSKSRAWSQMIDLWAILTIYNSLISIYHAIDTIRHVNREIIGRRARDTSDMTVHVRLWLLSQGPYRGLTRPKITIIAHHYSIVNNNNILFICQYHESIYSDINYVSLDQLMMRYNHGRFNNRTCRAPKTRQ